MEKIKICVIGLGYVGLPLARLFSTKFETIGFDMNQNRVDALMAGHDATLEVSDELLQQAIKNGFVCTTDLELIKDCNFYVVAVPTPVDENNRPDLKPLWGASETVGKVISKGDIVVYESTVYPGVTEEECLPVVERVSGLKFNVEKSILSWCQHDYHVLVDLRDDYVRRALLKEDGSQEYKTIKYCRLVRKSIKGKNRFYLAFCR